MVELYILFTLLGVGYILNQKRPVQMKTGTDQLHVNERPTPNNVYESNHVQKARAMEAARVQAMYARAAADPSKVVPKYPAALAQTPAPVDVPPMAEKPKTVFSQLAGMDIPVEHFEHNNMMPFFRGSVKQNMENFSAQQAKLEAFTGVSDLYFSKREQEPLFKQERNIGNVFGTANQSDFYQSRMPTLTLRNNELPAGLEQIRVGPGLGADGFSSDPTGGFQQFEIQEAALRGMPTVDDLRVLSKPKTTFEGRTVDGMKEKMRGEQGLMFKNRDTCTVAETGSPENWLRTTGAVIKERSTPIVEVKATNRKDTGSRSYKGPAYQNREFTQKADVRAPHKLQLPGYEMGGADMERIGRGSQADYGKASIQVYANEREVTTTRTHQGNVTSLVKSIVAPIEDMFRLTKRIHTTEHPRENAELQPQFPAKLTIYDPNDIARTTLKETLLHSADHPNIDTFEKKGKVYDPEEFKPKTTVRETLDPKETTLNMSTLRRTGKVFDPEDVAKTTVKETNLQDRSDAGQLALQDRQRGAYTETDHDPRLTQKQFLSQVEYTGHADQTNKNAGYKVANPEAKDTQKQFLSDHDYYGTAETVGAKSQMSYDDIYNATLNEIRELTLVQREPTQTSVKVASGIDGIEAQMPRKPMCDPTSTRSTLNQVPIAGGSGVGRETMEEGVTHVKQSYCDTERLDASILKPLADNPFALRLT